MSDVELPDGISGAASYEVDGAAYAVPYRQDSWVLYYNKALFDAAGRRLPRRLVDVGRLQRRRGRPEQGSHRGGKRRQGRLQHRWQSTVQGFASAQSDADVLEGDYEYMEPFYDNVLALQADGNQIDYNTSAANQLTYQGEFGKQNAAMLQMGTWFVATLIAQQASGDADDFEWGIAPIPQVDDSTAGLDNTPVTFGDPTGLGINAAIDESKVQAAKDFLAFAAGEEGAQILAGIGITPALLSDSVVETYFAVDGAPTDDLSKFAYSTHEVHPENPTSSKTAAIQGILNDMHTAIMSGSTPVDDAITAGAGPRRQRGRTRLSPLGPSAGSGTGP